MASISSISSPNLTFPKQNLPVPFPLRRPSLLHFPSQPLCLCLNSVADDSHNNTNNNDRRWYSMLHEFVTDAMKQFESYVNAFKKGRAADEDQGDVSDEGWDWNRWRQHFDEVDDQERIVIILKVCPRYVPFISFCFLCLSWINRCWLLLNVVIVFIDFGAIESLSWMIWFLSVLWGIITCRNSSAKSQTYGSCVLLHCTI